MGERQSRNGGQGSPRATDVLEGEDATPLLRNTSPHAQHRVRTDLVLSRGVQAFQNAVPPVCLVNWHMCQRPTVLTGSTKAKKKRNVLTLPPAIPTIP